MKFVPCQFRKQKPTPPLGFGRYFTDYMFTMRYREGEGWLEPSIEPNAPVSFDLATSIFHYAQGVFEGMKAFRQPDGGLAVFRPDENWARMNNSADRLCIPRFDERVAEEGLEELLRLEREWVPEGKGTALYIRPAIIATRPALGVHASSEYLFFIILSPVGNYFERGREPTKLLVEENFCRAFPGGTGEAKCLGNYAVSLKAGELAARQGFDQVLWLDAAERKYVEEVGSMNIFFVIDGEVVTPALVGSILPGITRKSCLSILRERRYRVSERRISIEEVAEAAESGALEEVFGTGTAAVVAPVGVIRYRGHDYVVRDGKAGKITQMLYDTVTGIQNGVLSDPHGWCKKVL